MTARLDLFRAEEEAVFSAGLRASAYVSVDDTGARHAGKACYTTQFGSDRFTAFRTGPSKSRLMFLRNLLGGTARYAINAAAVAYMRAANLAHGVIDALSGAEVRGFASEADWQAHLCALCWRASGSALIRRRGWGDRILKRRSRRNLSCRECGLRSCWISSWILMA